MNESHPYAIKTQQGTWVLYSIRGLPWKHNDLNQSEHSISIDLDQKVRSTLVGRVIMILLLTIKTLSGVDSLIPVLPH